MDAFYALGFSAITYLGTVLTGRQSRPLQPDQEAYSEIVLSSLKEFCTKRSDPVNVDPTKNRVYHVITFQKPNEITLAERVKDCTSNIYEILANQCDRKTMPLLPEPQRKTLSATVEDIQSVMKEIQENWDTALSYAQFTSNPGYWEIGWLLIKKRIEAIQTGWPKNPVTKPLEDWKMKWLNNIRILKENLAQWHEAKEQMTSQKMRVIVTQVRNEATIEKLWQVKRQLREVGFEKLAVNIDFYRQFLSNRNQPGKIFPSIEEFKELGVDGDALAFFIVRVEEVIQEKPYPTQDATVTKPRKLGMEPDPEPQAETKKTTTSKAFLSDQFSVQHGMGKYDGVKFETYMHEIVERALHNLNQELASADSANTKPYDADRYHMQIITIPYPERKIQQTA